MAYTPPYEITNTILGYVASISEKIGRISERSNLESRPHIRRNNKIRSIHSSLRIEANALSLGEVRDIIGGRKVLGSAKEVQEVKNAYNAYGQIQHINPYSLNDLKRLHGIMTKYIIDESGVFRKGEEGVFNGDKCIFMAPPARLVPSQMDDLFAWMQQNHNMLHPLILAAIFHYEFVFIHPFADGNGRMARLWHTVILTKWKPIFEFVPIESQIEKFQDGYYQAIADCHVNGSSTRFIEYILGQIDIVLNDTVNQAHSTGDEVSEYEKRLLDIMEYDVPYTATRLLGLLDMKSKDSLRKNYILPALEHGTIEMTIPDKPKSKNQRYIKK